MSWNRPPRIQVRGTRATARCPPGARGRSTPGGAATPATASPARTASPASGRGTPAGAGSATPRTVRTRPRRPPVQQSPGPNDPTCPPPRPGKWPVRGHQAFKRGHREYKWHPMAKKWAMYDHMRRIHPDDECRLSGEEPPPPCEFHLAEGERLLDPSWPEERREQWRARVKYVRHKERVEKFEKNIPYNWVPPEEQVPVYRNVKKETPPEERKRRAMEEKRKKMKARSTRWQGQGVSRIMSKYSGKSCKDQIKLMDPAPSGAARYMKYDPDFKTWSRYNTKHREHPADKQKRLMSISADHEFPQPCSPPRDSTGKIIHPKNRTAAMREKALRALKWEAYQNECDAWDRDADYGGTDAAVWDEPDKDIRARIAAREARRHSMGRGSTPQARTPSARTPSAETPSARSAGRAQRPGVTPSSCRTPRSILRQREPGGPITPRRRRAVGGIQFEYPGCMVLGEPEDSTVRWVEDFDADTQPTLSRRSPYPGGSPPPDPESPVEQPVPFMPIPPVPGTPPPLIGGMVQDCLLTPRHGQYEPLARQRWPQLDMAQRWGVPQSYEFDREGPDPFSPPPVPSSGGARGDGAPPRAARVRFHETAHVRTIPPIAGRTRPVPQPFQMRKKGTPARVHIAPDGTQIPIEGTCEPEVALPERTPERPLQRWPRTAAQGAPSGTTPSRVRKPLKRPRQPLLQPRRRPNLNQKSRVAQYRQSNVRGAREAQRRAGVAGPGTPLPIVTPTEGMGDQCTTPVAQPQVCDAPHTVAVPHREYAPDAYEKWEEKLEQDRIQASTANYMRRPFIYDQMMPPFFEAHPTVVRYDPRCAPRDTFDSRAQARLDEPEEEIQLTARPPEPWELIPRTEPGYWLGRAESLEAAYEPSPPHVPFRGHARPMVPTPPRIIPAERRWPGMPEPFGDEYRRTVWSQRDNLIWDPQSQGWTEDPTVRITRLYNPEAWFGPESAVMRRPASMLHERARIQAQVPVDCLTQLAYQQSSPMPTPAREWTPPRTPPQPLDVSGEECYTPGGPPPLAINPDIVVRAAEIINKRIADAEFIQRMEAEHAALEERLRAQRNEDLRDQPVQPVGPFNAADWYRLHPDEHHPTLPCPTGCVERGCPIPMPPPPPPPVSRTPGLEAFTRRPYGGPMSAQRLLRGVFSSDPDGVC